MKKQLLIFMTPEDERAFSIELKRQFGDIVVLDDNVWPTPYPIMANSIDQCKSGYAHLWNRSLFPGLPVGPRPDGRFQGPTVGPVLQFARCILEDNVLRSGRVALGLDRRDITPEVEKYIKEVWRMVKGPATSQLICIDPQTGEVINSQVRSYWAWPDAVRWCVAERGRFLRDRATQNFCVPARP